MKKALILIFTLISCFHLYGQNSITDQARNFLAEKNYREAMNLLNEATEKNETKGNAEVWYLRGMAYLQQAVDTTVNEPRAAEISYNSLMKALALKPDYGSEINNGLYSNALLAFNHGVMAYKNNAAEAYDAFMRVLEIYKIDKGKRFLKDNNFSPLAKSAKQNAAYSAVSARKYNEALVLLRELKDVSGAKDSNVYQMLTQIYNEEKNDAQLLTTIAEARRHFPNSALFRNIEINYYISRGQSVMLEKKLEEAVKADPQNAELFFNLANVYYRNAFPKDKEGADLPRPANFPASFAKAETAYQKAISLKPSNHDYHYNLGVLYYENAANITKEMTLITGTGAEDQKKYESLLGKRDGQFSMALPHFENAYKILSPRVGQLNAEEKQTYRNVLTGLKEIFSRRNDQKAAAEYKAKLDEL